MSIAGKLRKLIDIKGAIKEALFYVGQEVADKMEDWAMSIRNICNVPFENLGWSAEESKMLNATLKNMYLNGMYSKDKLNGSSNLSPYLNIYRFPFVSKIGDFQLDSYSEMLNANYKTTPFLKMVFTKSELTHRSLSYAGYIYIDIDFTQPIVFKSAFSNCASVIALKLNVTNVTDFGNFINNSSIGDRSSLRSLKLIGLGSQDSAVSIDLSSIYYLGQPFPPEYNDVLATNARKDLVDSLLTNSFDRASAGYSVFTITLLRRVFNLLTEEEITAITNKGYTLTIV